MKKISNLLMMALLAIGMGLTSCDEQLDNAVNPGVMPDVDEIVAVTITTAPTATAGNILAGSTTALITVVTADGGTMMYKVTSDNIQPTSTDGFSAEVPTAAALAMGTYFVWYYAKAADAQHSDSEIAATPVEVTVKPGLSTPLTIEAITAGTIKVSSPKSGMKYSTDGGITKLPVSANPTDISVAAGDKVAFYGTATSYNGTMIGGADDGGTFKCKVYGNIMSLVDETGFATNTNTTLTADYTFSPLFYDNAKLTDASGLLLPAKTLTENCYFNMFAGCTALTAAPAELPAETLTYGCYQQMFAGCTALTTAPKLPAMALDKHCYECMFDGCKALTETPKLPAQELKENCYYGMFRNCTSLTTAYVKAAYSTNCVYMFLGCTNAATSTFYSDHAANWKSNFSTYLSNWQIAAYPTE